MRVEVDGDLNGSQLENRVVTHLYRIAQEAVTNAVKHAQADAIRIDVKSGSGVTRLRVSDNGIGIPSNGDRHEGLGLRVMRHRAGSIRASLTIRANPSGGTVVTCTLRQPPALLTATSSVATPTLNGSAHRTPDFRRASGRTGDSHGAPGGDSVRRTPKTP